MKKQINATNFTEHRKTQGYLKDISRATYRFTDEYHKIRIYKQKIV